MATRLYFVATTAPAISPPFDAGWSSTADVVRRTLATSQAATTETLAGSVANTATSLAVQLVSPPLTAQTISGTFTLVSRGRELATTDNVNQRWRSVRVYSGDGATLRGTLNSYAVTGSTTELATSLTGQPHAVNGSLTSVVCQAGDVIVVEVGYGLSATGTTPQWEMVLGGAGTDHTTSVNDATGSVPWVEFSANLVWQAVGSTVSGIALADLSFSAAGVGVRSASGAAPAAFDFGAVASGTRTVSGSAAAPVAFAAAASGARTVLGQSAVPIGFAAGASGVRAVWGAAAAPLAFDAASTGDASPGAANVPGAAVAQMGFAASSSGVRAVSGLASVLLDLVAVAAGVGSTPGAAVTRPDTGPTIRPTTGVVIRPAGGVVARPTGTVVRPFTGTVTRP